MKINRPIAIAFILFAIVVFVFFLVMPQYRIFRNLQQELGEKRAEYNAKYEYFSAIAKAYNELQNRTEELQKIDDALPQDPNMAGLIYFLQKKCGDNGLITNSISLARSSGIKQSENMKEIIFSLNVTGTYSSLGNFIASLEKSARLLEVSTIAFNYGSGQQTLVKNPLAKSSGIYSFSLEIKTYSY